METNIATNNSLDQNISKVIKQINSLKKIFQTEFNHRNQSFDEKSSFSMKNNNISFNQIIKSKTK